MSIFVHNDIDNILINYLEMDDLRKLYQVNTYYNKMVRNELEPYIKLFSHIKIKGEYKKQKEWNIFLSAMMFGDIKVCKYLKGKFGGKFFDEKFSYKVLQSAVRYDRLIILKWLYEEYNSDILIHILQYACEYNKLEIAQWTHSIDKTLINGECNFFGIACENGYLELAQWLNSIYPDYHGDIEEEFMISCERGNLNILQWLYTFDKNILDGDCETCFIIACENGNIDVAKWLYSIGANIHLYSDSAIKKSITNNHYEITKWLKTI